MLKDWKIWIKLTLIAVMLLPLAGFLFYQSIKKYNEDIRFTEQEVLGARYLDPLFILLSEVEAHRGQVARYLGNRADSSTRAAALELEDRVDSALRDLKNLDELGDALAASSALILVEQDWSTLKAGAMSSSMEQSFERHSQLIARIVTLMEDVGDTSNIRLDPVLETYYLGEVAELWGPRAVEDLGRLRDQAATFLVQGGTEVEAKARLGVLLAASRGNLDSLERALRLAMGARNEFKSALENSAGVAADQTGKFLDQVRLRIVDAATPSISAEEIFTSGSAAIKEQGKVHHAVLDLLQQELGDRADGYRFGRNVLIGVALGLLLAAAGLVYWVSRLITQQIGSIMSLFGNLGIGNFAARTQVYSNDELGIMATSLNAMLDNTLALIQSREERDRIQDSIIKLLDEISGVAEGDLTREAEVTAEVTGAIADSYNAMIQQLRRIISDVQETTLQVSSAANEIQTTTEHLAEGSEAQTLQIVDTSSAVDEIALSIQQVSENAGTAATVASEALQNSQRGTDAVGKTIHGMDAIRQQVQETAKRIKRLGESSQEIGEIVQLIGDIADRTSILALNASIQAAMAGEAGRGFAVVAEEVERLAERSAEATKRISTLIKTIQSETNEAVSAMEDTTREVVSGSGLANQAGQALEDIRNVSNRLAELIQSISLASKQQARGSESVAKAMSEISEVTQQTAAGTKQAAVSIRNLAHLADNLRDSVSAFKLPGRAGG